MYIKCHSVYCIYYIKYNIHGFLVKINYNFPDAGFKKTKLHATRLA